LLDISRIQGGRLVLEMAVVDIMQIVKEVTTLTQINTNQHTIEVKALVPIMAKVDPIRLEQVLSNLLTNAIKYSPEGGPINLDVATSEPDSILISVTDRGVGIPKEKRANIFQPFYRAHTTEQFGGLGLGLYISKQIVELHQGQIWAEFPEQGGTRFIVRLPANS
jgi:signal transduction histidine kinase